MLDAAVAYSVSIGERRTSAISTARFGGRFSPRIGLRRCQPAAVTALYSQQKMLYALHLIVSDRDAVRTFEAVSR